MKSEILQALRKGGFFQILRQDDLKNKSLATDASALLHSFCSSDIEYLSIGDTKMIEYRFVSYARMLNSMCGDHIFVFDGSRSLAKRDENCDRETRAAWCRKIFHLLEGMFNKGIMPDTVEKEMSDSLTAEEKKVLKRIVTDGKLKKEMTKYARMSFYISADLITNIVTALQRQGCRAVIAANEADDLLCFLYHSKTVDFIVSMDTAWMFND